MRQRPLPDRPGIDTRSDSVARQLRGLADPFRLRLLALLAHGDCPVGQLAAATGVGQSLVSFHLAALRDAGLITTERRGRFTYARLEPRAVAGLFDDVAEIIALDQHPRIYRGLVRTVLFAGLRGAGRTQMAAAFFNHLAPADLRGVAVGTNPADQIEPLVAEVMAEVGIDLSSARPRLLDQDLIGAAEVLVRVDRTTDVGRGKRWQDWGDLADPASLPVGEVRAIRDTMHARVAALVAELAERDAAQQLTVGERRSVQRVVEQLAEPFAGRLGRDRVERVVAEEIRRFRDARARMFIDVLVAKHAKERLRAMAQAEGRLSKQIPEVLFVCVQNAGRSQMAAALAEHLGGGRIHAWSAGSRPALEVHAEAAEAMAEIGIELHDEVPKPWTNELVRAADVVVTMGCGDDCPWFPGVRYVDWEVPDPAGRPLEEVRGIRDDLHERVSALITELTAADPAGDRTARPTTQAS